MGQAAVDLPDPLETPPVPSSAGSDDLLAQLAGEEIDRLLAETDRAPAPDERGAHPTPDAAGQTPDHNQPEQRDEWRVEADVESRAIGTFEAPFEPEPLSPFSLGPTVAAAGEALSHAPSSTDVVDDRSADAASEIILPPAAMIEAAVIVPQVPDLPSATERGLLAALEADESRPAGENALAADEETTSAERSGLDAGALNEVLSSAVAHADREDPLPLLLRPLAWLNAPLGACPEFVRDLIGKLAILTLANALAVLIYVLLVRRH